ncbi:MAG: hypothetical protein ACK5KT_08490 [Dysgonomonas sp.]
MKLKGILILLLLVCVSFSVDAQDRPDRPKRNGGGFDIEAIKKEKGDFLIKEMGLNEAEAKAFLPLEFEFMEKKFEVNRNTRHKIWELKQKKDKTDADFKKINGLNLEAKKKEAELEIEYYDKFAKVISAEKIEKYRIADLKFKEEMLKKHQQNRRNDNRDNRGNPDRR